VVPPAWNPKPPAESPSAATVEGAAHGLVLAHFPLGIVIVLAVSGIPLWLALKHPDERPVSAWPQVTPQPRPGS
jgi:hypothetical protein